MLLAIKLKIPLTLRFAILNIIGIWLFFGGKAVLLLGVLAIVLWLALRCVLWLKEAGRHDHAKFLGLLILLAMVSLFVGYKLYFDTALTTGATDSENPAPLVMLYKALRLISFSFVFLRVVDLIRSIVWGVERLINPISLTGYLGPFHMLIAGPITPYAQYIEADQKEQTQPTFSHLFSCVGTITTGLFYKVVVAQSMTMFLFGVEGALASGSWVDSAYLLCFLFFDFAGYSLIALGIGRLLQVPTPVNFDKPYLSTSVTEFWQRWHVSLGIFVKNNLFLPLYLVLVRRFNRRLSPTIISLLPLAVVFVFIAMWHRVTVAFFIWGVTIAAIMVVEKLVRDRFLTSTWSQRKQFNLAVKFVGPIYTLALIITSVHFVIAEIFAG